MSLDRFKFRRWDGYIRKLGHVNWFDIKDLDEFPDNYILMQCTGLKDSEGNLIYEGDILEWDTKEGMIFKYWVVWDDEFGAWTDHDKELTISELLKDEDNRIIGNIYENPELLQSSHA